MLTCNQCCNEEERDEKTPCDHCAGFSADAQKIITEVGIPAHIARKYADETGDADLSDLQEAYSGHFLSDKDFAMETADQLCSINLEDQPWPQYCIDWDFAARELMMDYTAIDGHYFRNL